jgi:hypothetical protein
LKAEHKFLTENGCADEDAQDEEGENKNRNSRMICICGAPGCRIGPMSEERGR